MKTGASEDEAKMDLCRAMADRKIDIRVMIASSEGGMGGQVFADGNVSVPTHLRPGDLDWVRSRPLAPWSIGPRPGEHYEWIGGWKNRSLDLIELSTADVIEILCGGEDGRIPSATAGQETAAVKALASHLKGNQQLTRAEAMEWLRTADFTLTERGFQSRIWPQAREQAGLQAKAPSGRPKSSR
jgi:hypothetical protein